MSNNLGRVETTASQNQKTVTLNESDGILDGAITDTFAHLVDDSDALAIAAIEMEGFFFQTLADDSPTPTSLVAVTVPAVERGVFVIVNNMTQDCTVGISAQPAVLPTVLVGELKLLICDGVNVYETFLGSADTVQVQPPYMGAVGTRSTTQSLSVITTWTPFLWDLEDFDTDGFHDTVSVTERMTIPSGLNITKVKLITQIEFLSIAVGGTDEVAIRIEHFNSADVSQGVVAGNFPGTEGGFPNRVWTATSKTVEVADGDYFVAQYFINQTETLTETNSYFDIMVVDRNVPLFPGHHGALVNINSTQSINNATATAIAWDAEVYDHPAGQNQFWLGFNATITTDFATDDRVDLTAHGMQTADGPFQFTTTTTLPAGLSVATDYWAIRVSDNEFEVATSIANAIAGTQVDITDNGTGTHTIDREKRLVVPQGVTQVRLSAAIEFVANTTGDRRLEITKNGAVVIGGGAHAQKSPTVAALLGTNSATLAVAPGDFFELEVEQNSSGNLNLLNANSKTWFSIEEVRS